MPNQIISSRMNTKRNADITAATASSSPPRFQLLWDKRQEMPQIRMNSPAKNGSTGLKKLNSQAAGRKPKRYPAV